MMQYEDLQKLKKGSIIYLVDNEDEKEEDYRIYETCYDDLSDEVYTVWRLELTAIQNHKCMLYRPKKNTQRYDVYKNEENKYVMFRTKKEAMKYKEEKEKEWKKDLEHLDEGELLRKLCSFYEQSLRSGYEMPLHPFDKKEFPVIKRMLLEKMKKET